MVLLAIGRHRRLEPAGGGVRGCDARHLVTRRVVRGSHHDAVRAKAAAVRRAAAESSGGANASAHESHLCATARRGARGRTEGHVGDAVVMESAYRLKLLRVQRHGHRHRRRVHIGAEGELKSAQLVEVGAET